eukprot:SAG31_NODE_4122_length_3562_cov_4.035230_3_plen_185_part_00
MYSFPWDHGTRNTGRAEYVDLVEAVIETGADGINGDTMNGVNASFWDEGILQGKAMAIEPEVMASTQGAITGLETNVMSWGQFWAFDKVPLVSAYKALEPRHLTHITERWTTNRTDGFHTAFFNGVSTYQLLSNETRSLQLVRVDSFPFADWLWFLGERLGNLQPDNTFPRRDASSNGDNFAQH